MEESITAHTKISTRITTTGRLPHKLIRTSYRRKMEKKLEYRDGDSVSQQGALLTEVMTEVHCATSWNKPSDIYHWIVTIVSGIAC